MTALFLWPIPFLCLLLAHKAQGPFKATLLLRDLEGEPVFITSLRIFIFVFVCFFFLLHEIRIHYNDFKRLE